nr:nucleotidyltransferase domain-containing protein [Bacteroidota bacterium]
MDNRIIVKELKKILVENLGDNVSDVVMFGSQLRGSALADSDIDILIVLNSDNDGALKRKINHLCYQIDLKYAVFLDTTIISKNELNSSLRGKHPLFINALQEGYYA